jgi:uncharacterized protein (DUF58 family)
MEFYGIRDYSPSDSLRRVNWKASSRSEELLSNQYLGEFGGDTIIVLDARTRSDAGVPPDSILTYSVRAAAVIAYRLLRDKNRVGILAFGSKLQKVRSGFGRRQFDRVLTALVNIRPGDIWGVENVPGYLSLFFSRFNQIVLISPLADTKSEATVMEIASKGYPTLVISPSPVDFASKSDRDTMVEEVADDLVRLERETRINVLRRYATIVDWNTREPLGSALRQAATQKVRAR